MAQMSAATQAVVPIDISHDELSAFHAAHFSATSTEHFATNFLGPAEDPPEAFREGGEEDDGLGYYEDGMKRTLTDEQIAMFRHSEIETLLRERRHAEEAGEPFVEAGQELNPGRKTAVSAGVKDGELCDDSHSSRAQSVVSTTISSGGQNGNGNGNGRGRNKKRGKNSGVRNLHTKPDLRKRTWDKVEKDDTGGLDYGEESAPVAARSSAPQRRKISYDDV